MVTTQLDHGHLSGEILSLWRADGLPDHPRRDDLLFAAREHDNGWRETDAAPWMDPETGRPHSFLSIPPSLRFEIWEKGIDRFAKERPYAALLIAEHAAHLHREHREDEAWRAFLERVDARRAELLEASEASEDEVRADYRFLELVDLVSLAACSRWLRPFELAGVRFEVEADPGARGEASPESRIRLEPFPLAGTTTFEVCYRRIPDRRYRGDADLGVELASARWRRAPVRIAPARG